MLWAIDGTLRSFLILPLEWFYPNFELAYNVNVVTTYVLYGGTFYAALAVGLTLLLGQRKAKLGANEA